MRIQALLIGTASLALIAGAASAQSQTQDPPQSPSSTPNSMQATPATTDQSANTSMGATTSMSQPMDTTTTPTRMYTNSAGVNVQVISNGPVPDTPENRARYGKPLSHAGKRTAPAGN